MNDENGILTNVILRTVFAGVRLNDIQTEFLLLNRLKTNHLIQLKMLL